MGRRVTRVLFSSHKLTRSQISTIGSCPIYPSINKDHAFLFHTELFADPLVYKDIQGGVYYPWGNYCMCIANV